MRMLPKYDNFPTSESVGCTEIVFGQIRYEVCTLAFGWAVTFGTARRGLGGDAATQAYSLCNSPPINEQCTNHRIAVYWLVALRF